MWTRRLRTGAVWAKSDDPRITSRSEMDAPPSARRTAPVVQRDSQRDGTCRPPAGASPDLSNCSAEQIPYYNYRHCVRPGITGWAQINYKYGDTLEDAIMKLEYDLYYIKNLSLSLDMFIMFHTLKVMLFSETAQ